MILEIRRSGYSSLFQVLRHSEAVTNEVIECFLRAEAIYLVAFVVLFSGEYGRYIHFNCLGCWPGRRLGMSGLTLHGRNWLRLLAMTLPEKGKITQDGSRKMIILIKK